VTVEKIKEGGFEVTLDGRRLKTPARKHLVLPNLELAHVLAAEWDFQEVLSDRGIEPATMPFMTLVSSAIDQADGEPSYYIERILTYLPTDSALFFTTRDDRILLKKQRKQLIPLVEFVRDIFGIELLTAEDGSIGKLIHPSESIRKFRDIIESLDPFVLSCMHAATIECKSAIIALALLCRRIDMDQARAASRIEEEFQVEIWGVVEGGHDMDRLNNSVKLAAVSTFMNLYWSTETTDQFARAWSSKRN
jgi:ATP synthase F1 complex assembly factor 2